MGVSLSDQQVQQLLTYAALIEKWNKHFNLVSRKDIARLMQRHIVDSLASVNLLRGPRVMDIGSGAGLPGIPLAIAAPDQQFTLCDRSARRTRFLSQAAQNLGLASVTVWQGDLTPEHGPDGKFDSVVARGVATALPLWAMVESYLAEHGRVLIYASTQADHHAEQQQPAHTSICTHRYMVPGLQAEHMILCLERT